MGVEYEWDVETVDEDGDVLDHELTSKLSPRFLARLEQPGTRLVLVRDVWGFGGVESRGWAYVEDGKLPGRFENACGSWEADVPKRFHAELARLT